MFPFKRNQCFLTTLATIRNTAHLSIYALGACVKFVDFVRLFDKFKESLSCAQDSTNARGEQRFLHCI